MCGAPANALSRVWRSWVRPHRSSSPAVPTTLGKQMPNPDFTVREPERVGCPSGIRRHVKRMNQESRANPTVALSTGNTTRHLKVQKRHDCRVFSWDGRRCVIFTVDDTEPAAVAETEVLARWPCMRSRARDVGPCSGKYGFPMAWSLPRNNRRGIPRAAQFLLASHGTAVWTDRTRGRVLPHQAQNGILDGNDARIPISGHRRP